MVEMLCLNDIIFNLGFLFQSHDTSKGDIPVSSVVTVKWGDVEEELFTAKVTGRKISVTYQVFVKEPEQKDKDNMNRKITDCQRVSFGSIHVDFSGP